MNRIGLGIVLAMVIGFGAPPASALVTWTVATTTSAGNPLDAVLIGEEITFDITLRSDGAVSVFGVEGAATGYDPTAFEFVGGQVSEQVLNQVCVSTFGCLNGMGNLVDVPIESLANPLGPEVQFMSGYAGAGTPHTGAVDPGVVTGAPGDPQFRLVFRRIGRGGSAFHIGSDPAYGDVNVVSGGVLEEAINATVEILPIPVPEPGTALLLGLGLVGLASTPRSARRRHEA